MQTHVLSVYIWLLWMENIYYRWRSAKHTSTLWTIGMHPPRSWFLKNKFLLHKSWWSIMSHIVSTNLTISTQYAQSLILGMTHNKQNFVGTADRNICWSKSQQETTFWTTRRGKDECAPSNVEDWKVWNFRYMRSCHILQQTLESQNLYDTNSRCLGMKIYL